MRRVLAPLLLLVACACSTPAAPQATPSPSSKPATAADLERSLLLSSNELPGWTLSSNPKPLEAKDLAPLACYPQTPGYLSGMGANYLYGHTPSAGFSASLAELARITARDSDTQVQLAAWLSKQNGPCINHEDQGTVESAGLKVSGTSHLTLLTMPSGTTGGWFRDSIPATNLQTNQTKTAVFDHVRLQKGSLAIDYLFITTDPGPDWQSTLLTAIDLGQQRLDENV